LAIGNSVQKILESGLNRNWKLLKTCQLKIWNQRRLDRSSLWHWLEWTRAKV